jgi:hypothetical protein
MVDAAWEALSLFFECPVRSEAPSSAFKTELMMLPFVLEDENKLEGSASILRQLDKEVRRDGKRSGLPLFVHGDQLTTSRARSVMALLANEKPGENLQHVQVVPGIIFSISNQ